MINYSNQLQQLVTQVQIEKEKLGSRNEKKNNCMDISSNKLARLHTRRC